MRAEATLARAPVLDLVLDLVRVLVWAQASAPARVVPRRKAGRVARAGMAAAAGTEVSRAWPACAIRGTKRS